MDALKNYIEDVKRHLSACLTLIAFSCLFWLEILGIFTRKVLRWFASDKTMARIAEVDRGGQPLEFESFLLHEQVVAISILTIMMYVIVNIWIYSPKMVAGSKSLQKFNSVKIIVSAIFIAPFWGLVVKELGKENKGN